MPKIPTAQIKNDLSRLGTLLNQEKHQPLDYKAAMVMGWGYRSISGLIRAKRV